MFEYYGNLYADLSGIFQPFKVDLVFFHEVQALLKYEMIRGQCVYAADRRRTDDDEEMVKKEMNAFLERYRTRVVKPG
jgi:hypothetical protein